MKKKRLAKPTKACQMHSQVKVKVTFFFWRIDRHEPGPKAQTSREKTYIGVFTVSGTQHEEKHKILKDHTAGIRRLILECGPSTTP